VEYNGQPAALAALLEQLLPENLLLVTISNRGTQVWPTGSNLTNCVNQYRARFEKRENDTLQPAAIFELCSKIDTQVRICSVEMLLNIDGAKAYSLAQGQ
jgi:isocitrate dehydrogenase